MAECPILKKKLQKLVLSPLVKWLHNLLVHHHLLRRFKTQLKCKLSLDNAATVATDEQKAKPQSARDENV